MTDDAVTKSVADQVGRAGERTAFTGRIVGGAAGVLYVELETGVRVRVRGSDADAWVSGDLVRVEGRIPCTESALVPGAHAPVMANRIERVQP